MPRTFTTRLALAFAAVAVATAVVIVALVNVTFDASFSSYLRTQARTQQDQLVASLAESYRRNGGWDAADLQAVTLAALPSGGVVRIESPSGETVWQGPRRGMGPGPGGGTGVMAGAALGSAVRVPVEVGNQVVGFASIRQPQLGTQPGDAAFRATVTWLILAGGAVAVLLAGGLGLLLARLATGPARRVTAAARALAGGQRDTRIEVSGPEEFAEMADAFNRMAQSVEDEDRLRRSFANDVAHEMRTPLAVLQAHVEGLQDQFIEPTRREMDLLHDEVRRASRLVADLEVVGETAAARFSMDMVPLDLRELVATAVAEIEPLVAERGITVRSELASSRVLGDAGRLRQVVGNLLSNALKFTASGGVIRVDLRPEGDEAILVVEDTGQGISPSDLPHVFDRFFRGRDARAGGSGIGLAVVRELVTAHGGTVQADSTPGRGSTFTVRLPLSASESAGNRWQAHGGARPMT